MDTLKTIKAVHTAIWAIVAACILAIPLFAWSGMFLQVFWMTGIVLVEVFVLALNGWQCPLTSMAARYTEDRQDNFDIYLPLWLARYNKVIFGLLFVGGEVVAILRWCG